MITQISRFDPWKDPLGVIDVYRAVKREFPDLQLVMIASMASDDPEGWDWYERTVRRAGEDFDIHILSNLNGVGNVEVNAFQRAARVVIQKSVREGFGLVVSEALMEGTSGRRGQRRRHPAADRGWRDGLPREYGGGVRREAAVPAPEPRGGGRRWARGAWSSCATTSSRRGTCETT